MNSDQIQEVGNLEEFKKRMWKTKGARFNAHARLLAKYNCSIFTIAFSSIVVIIITVIPFIFTLNIEQSNIISISTIIYALFILIFSLIESSKSHQLKAMQLHQCAVDIAALYDQIKIISSTENTQGTDTKFTEIKKIAEQYNEIIKRCHENHETIDYDVLRLRNRQEFNMGKKEALLINIKSKLYYIPYVLIIVIPLATIILTLIII